MSMAIALDNTLATDFEESMRSKYEPRIKELNSMAEEIARSGKKDEFGYLVVGLSKLTSMMLDCDQYDFDIDPNGEAVLVDRVIRINRYVNNSYLNFHGIDHVVIGGLFLTAPIYLLPGEKVKAASKNRYHSVMNPEEFGLPSEKVCHYGTIKPLTNNVYMAIAKFENNYVNEIVNSVRHYDYVFLR